ncbi:inositol monophosphatase family protein [Prosthecomicrobium sp. N25]|uniref:inositol monophosphatase family protein n=1 Tax=Prosthecomicrobium sp. N25 TaxID=3129254 RepID=UPI00307794E0
MPTFTRADLADLGAILREAADVEILPRFRRLETADVSTKAGPHDLVTIADQAAERLIAARLADRFPAALMVGEESAALDPDLPARLGGSDFAITVDPIDGTFNYANGVPLFGVMAGVVIGGRIVAGAIYDPFGRDFAYALAGGGAWFEDESGRTRPMRVAAPAELGLMHGALSWNYLSEPQRSRVAARMPRLWGSYGYRCAAHEYRLIASGGGHLALYGKLMPWDHVPGWLIHQEAGGYSATADGRPYDPARTDGSLLLAPDEASWRLVRDTLFG